MITKEFSVKVFKESLNPDASVYWQVGEFIHKNSRMVSVQTTIDPATGDVYYAVTYDYSKSDV